MSPEDLSDLQALKIVQSMASCKAPASKREHQAMTRVAELIHRVEEQAQTNDGAVVEAQKVLAEHGLLAVDWLDAAEIREELEELGRSDLAEGMRDSEIMARVEVILQTPVPFPQELDEWRYDFNKKVAADLDKIVPKKGQGA